MNIIAKIGKLDLLRQKYQSCKKNALFAVKESYLGSVFIARAFFSLQ